jgi:hypothetical protein
MRSIRNIGAVLAVAIGVFNLSTSLRAQAFSSPVRDIDNSARQPVFFSPTLPALANHIGVDLGLAVNVYTVPAGKRLVITYIGFYGPSTAAFRGLLVTAHPTDTNLPNTSQAVAPCTQVGNFNIASQQVFLFGNPGDQIDVALQVDVNGSFAGAMIAGYLVNLP